MLYLVSPQNINNVSPDSYVIYNFNSMVERYPLLHLLPPFQMVIDGDDGNAFDQLYAQWIISGADQQFTDFMMIMQSLYNNKNVLLLVDTSSIYSENLVESLVKLIRNRYGYCPMYANSFEDLFNAEESDFSDEGNYTFHQDLQRLAIILQRTFTEERQARKERMREMGYE